MEPISEAEASLQRSVERGSKNNRDLVLKISENMKNKPVLFVIFTMSILIVNLFFSKDSRLENIIIDFYENNCIHTKEYCLIDLSKVINDWDYIYIFNKGISNESIETIIGDKYKAKEDISYKTIITKNSKIKSFFEIFIKPFERDSYSLTFNYGNIIYDNKIENEEFDFYKINQNNPVLVLKKTEVKIDENFQYTVYTAYPSNKKQTGIQEKS